MALSELCISAFHSEHYGRYEEATERHHQAIEQLNRIVESNSFFDPDLLRVSRKQIKFHTARLRTLARLKDSGEPGLDIVLPTSLSLQEELTTLTPDGSCCLSYEEFFLAKWARDPNSKPPLSMAHLIQSEVPYFTPTLDLDLAPTSYDVYVKAEALGPDLTVYYISARSSEESGGQTLYVLQALKAKREQISEARLHRSTELTTPCIQVVISSTKQDRDPISTSEKGRTMRFNTTSPRPVIEIPDRVGRKGWSNRRFSLAGRDFVWMTEGRNEAGFSTCWETECVWAKPGSKTGKKEHTLLPHPLCWGDTLDVSDIRRRKMGVVYMAGGLDQMFREYLLASQLAKFLVVVYGHSD